MPKIGLISGSLRKAAYSKKIANLLANLLPNDLTPVFIPIDKLPLYNADLEDQQVAAWDDFRRQLDEVAGLIFVTPEYNRSMTGALKNALDVGSKPRNHWKYKTALVVSSSPEATGGFGANHHLRQVLVTLNVNPVQRPEVYLGHVNHLFNDQDLVTNPDVIAFLQSAVTAFVSLHARLAAVPTRPTPTLKLNFQPGRFYANDDTGSTLANIIFEDRQNHRIAITETFVDERLRGQGIAKQLMLRVIRFAQIYHLTIIPECTYADAFLEKHLEYASLVAPND
ncbi:GNAT family N-acetyltransferase [Secundilactobacillus folii]|uniref:GNAT family N-acetyltransferase n=1 Tax=Secundilactobacillus folii TaxID=2678357 RepID=UPI001563787B|nr:GNAT family N-acetyltransferase [Secundilactobacillus folii]